MDFVLPDDVPAVVQRLCDEAKARLISRLSALTLDDLEAFDEDLEKVTNLFYGLLYSNATPQMEEDAQKIGPITAAFRSDLLQNKELFAAVDALWNARDGLSVQDRAALEVHWLGFKRNGVDLPADKQDRLRAIDARLSQLSPAFAETARKSGKAFALHLTDANDVAGVPETALASAQEDAKAQGNDGGWLFTLDIPSYLPFITYATRRELREKIWRAYARRGMDAPHCTYDALLEIVRLRHERAQILGADTHADYVLERRMAEKVDTVRTFNATMQAKAKPAALRQLQELRDFAAQQDGIADLKPWDVAYYSEKLKAAKYNFDEEQLRPYFPIESAVKGVFTHIEKLFGIGFEALPDIPVYHPDVTAYAVRDVKTKAPLGTLYFDPYPRDAKKSGAWQGTFRERRTMANGDLGLPIVYVVCNFTKPTADAPALLTFDEVETLYHEFGHACHSLLTEVNRGSISGTSVFWDFVELPSQIMENWLYETETLDMFARHYKTGEPIPRELVKALQSARTYMAGWQLWRQLQLGALDMAWHDKSPDEIGADVVAFERRVLDPMALLSYEDGCVSASFTHLFAGGYSAGYYSYLWAEVLDADAFALFQEKGLYDPVTGQTFRREVLAKGGSAHPAELFRNFRGRDASVDALLIRRGLAA